MIDVVKETVFDLLKLLPFLFVTFFIIEFIEHKLNNKDKKAIVKAGKFGPIIGGLLGAFPQCGFGVAATNLYVTRIISIGTLVSVYLSTSDEMLPLLIANKSSFSLIIKILAIKVFIGIITGVVLDFILRKKRKNVDIKDFCEHNHCDCEHSLLKSSLKHTISVALFIFFISFLLNVGLFYLGENTIENILLKDSFFSPFLASLIGLIPNCAASVVITDVFIKGMINFGSLISGLLTGAGVSLLVLFKSNKSVKENLFIIGIIYFVGVISGLIINLI